MPLLGEAPLRLMPCIYCQSVASEPLSLGLCEKSHLHTIADIILHVATWIWKPYLITDPKDARGACLGSALPSWLRSHPQYRTTVMRASGSILLCQ